VTAPWSCADCSTTNAPGDDRCAVCGSSRPTDATSVLPVPPSPYGSPRPGSGSAGSTPTGPHQGGVIGSAPVGPSVPVIARGAPGAGQGAAPAAPIAAPTAGVVAGGGGAPGSSRTALLVAVVAVLAVAVGVGAFLLVSGGGGGDEGPAREPVERASETNDGDEGEARAGEVEPVEVEVEEEPEPVEVLTTTTAEALPKERQARLWAGTVKLRPEPDLAVEGTELGDVEGRTVTVLGPMVDGWYEVELDGRRGYMYAGLVVPPEPGWCVVLGPDAWLTDFGATRLVVDYSLGFEVGMATLPDGGSYVVGPDDVREQRCG